MISTDAGEVRFHKPIVYQPVGAGLALPSDARRAQEGLPKGAASSAPTAQDRRPVDGGFVLLADNRIGFDVGAYDRTKPLVIDPVLAYSTYLGGGGDDFAWSIRADGSGNAYIAGGTTSTNFPTLNAVQSNFGGGPEDGFVAVLNPGGSALVYSTYLGGSGSDRAGVIAVDGSGNTYLGGSTNSTNFPVTPGAMHPSYAGGSSDGFVAKIATAVPFASFGASVQITNNLTAFGVEANFTLGTGSNGINPVSEAVSLQIGTFSATIPAGSFTQDEEGNFTFEGVINGVTLETEIQPLGGGSFGFSAEGTGANLSGTANPVPVTLTIGDDTGSTTVTAEFD